MNETIKNELKLEEIKNKVADYFNGKDMSIFSALDPKFYQIIANRLSNIRKSNDIDIDPNSLIVKVGDDNSIAVYSNNYYDSNGYSNFVWKNKNFDNQNSRVHLYISPDRKKVKCSSCCAGYTPEKNGPVGDGKFAQYAKSEYSSLTASLTDDGIKICETSQPCFMEAIGSNCKLFQHATVTLSETDLNGLEMNHHSYVLSGRDPYTESYMHKIEDFFSTISAMSFNSWPLLKSWDFITLPYRDESQKYVWQTFTPAMLNSRLYIDNYRVELRVDKEKIRCYEGVKKDGVLYDKVEYALAKTPYLFNSENPKYQNEKDFERAMEMFQLQGGIEGIKNTSSMFNVDEVMINKLLAHYSEDSKNKQI